MSKSLVKNPVDRLKLALTHEDVQRQFKNALGKHSDLFTASLIDVYGSNQQLQNCAPALVIKEALKAAILKLPISKNLGLAYIVPYKGKPEFQIGYKGLIQLAMRSGQVKTINAGPVYDGEFVSHNRLTGVLDISGEMKNDKVTGYFCYLELTNGFVKADYWTKLKIITHAKSKSPSYGHQKSTWSTDFDAMATKTVIAAVFGKYAPKSIEFIGAMEYESEEQPQDITPEVEDLTTPPDTKPQNKKKAEKASAEDVSDFQNTEDAELDKLKKDGPGF